MAEENKNEKYELLNKELPVIAKVVALFPESVQPKVFDTLVSALFGAQVNQSNMTSVSTPTSVLPHGDISMVAIKTDKGAFQFNDIDLKAKTRTEAIQRLICIAIRAHELVMGESKVSRKTVLNKLMKRWGLTAGGDRTELANINGLHKEDDNYYLDIPAKKRADTYISEVLNPELVGTWTSKPRKTVSRTQKKKDKDEEGK